MAVTAQKKKRKSSSAAVGRRKTSSARIRFDVGETESIIVNGVALTEHKDSHLADVMMEPIRLIAQPVGGLISVKVVGGGLHSQAQAVRHGIARLLVQLNPEYRSLLKSKGCLTRDSRMKERKKPGLKRARRSPQWSKR